MKYIASEFEESFAFGEFSRYRAEPYYSERFGKWFWAVKDAESLDELGMLALSILDDAEFNHFVIRKAYK